MTIPPFFNVECAVKEQRLVTARHLSSELVADEEVGLSAQARNGLRRVQFTNLYPLQVDTSVNAEYVQTSQHPIAASVDFAHQVQNFFTHQGGFFVKALHTQSLEYEDSSILPGQVHYFAKVQDVEGYDPNTSIGKTGGRTAKEGEEDAIISGEGNSGWMITVIVGSVALVGSVGLLIFMTRKETRSLSSNWTPSLGGLKKAQTGVKTAQQREDSRNNPSKTKVNSITNSSSSESPSVLLPLGGKSDLVDLPPSSTEGVSNSISLVDDSISHGQRLGDGLHVLHNVSRASGIGGARSVEEEYELAMYEESSLMAGSYVPMDSSSAMLTKGEKSPHEIHTRIPSPETLATTPLNLKALIRRTAAARES